VGLCAGLAGAVVDEAAGWFWVVGKAESMQMKADILCCNKPTQTGCFTDAVPPPSSPPNTTTMTHYRGFWEDGVPVGPFRSRETGSASSFVCLQFAITSNLGHWMTTCLPLPSVRWCFNLAVGSQQLGTQSTEY